RARRVTCITSCHTAGPGGVLKSEDRTKGSGTMTNQKTRVVVIGGGYAGTLAANHLQLRDDVDVTLVNPRPEFVERIRLHQLAAAQRLRAALEAADAQAPIVVVGGGLTGVELASELAEQDRNVTLACAGELAPYLSAPGRRSMHAWFRRHAVEVLPDRVIEVR